MGSIYKPELKGKATDFGKMAANSTLKAVKKAGGEVSDFLKGKVERRKAIGDAKFKARLKMIEKTGVDPGKKEMKFF